MIRTEPQVLLDLLLPFPQSDVSWKPGALNRAAKDWPRDKEITADTFKGPRGQQPLTMAMAYADLRAYQRRLDKACGLNWTVRYLPWGDKRIICEISITVSVHGEPVVITRSGTGEYDEGGGKDAPEGTAAEAQAFKRACAMFGLGRYLYDTASTWTQFDPRARSVTPDGKKELEKIYLARYVEVINGLAASGFLSKEDAQTLLAQVRGKTQPAPQTTGSKPDAPDGSLPASPPKTTETPAAKPAVAPVATAAPTGTAAPRAETKPGSDAAGNVWELWNNGNEAKTYAKTLGLNEKDCAVLWSDALREGNGLTAANRAAFEIFYNKVQKVQEKQNG